MKNNELLRCLENEKINKLLHSLWFHQLALVKEEDEVDRFIIRKNIEFAINLLDNEGVSYEVQNRVINLAVNKGSYQIFRTKLVKEKEFGKIVC